MSSPDLLPGVRVIGGYEPADTALTARGSDHNLAVGDQRRHRHVIAGSIISYRRFPGHLACSGVEGYHERIVGRVVDLVAVEADASVRSVRVTHVLGELSSIAPELVAGSCVDGDDLVFGCRHEHDAVVDDRW